MFTAAILLFIKHLFIQCVSLHFGNNCITNRELDCCVFGVFFKGVKSRPDIAVAVEQLFLWDTLLVRCASK